MSPERAFARIAGALVDRIGRVVMKVRRVAERLARSAAGLRILAEFSSDPQLLGGLERDHRPGDSPPGSRDAEKSFECVRQLIAVLASRDPCACQPSSCDCGIVRNGEG
jgi:hypothetical protein